MSGTSEGARKARDKILRDNPDHYREIGKVGGEASGTGGWHYLKEHDPERLKRLGAKGGRKSKRGKNRPEEQEAIGV